MRIAQVSPLWESVPPRRYGGTERVVHHLSEALVRRGHEVVLFASGDSRCSAELQACCPRALRLDRDEDGRPPDPLLPSLLQLERVLSQRQRFDVLHFHTGPLHLPASSRLPVAAIETLHGPLSDPALRRLYGRFPQAALVSISDAQRDPMPQARWLATVHHGLPVDLYAARPEAQPYLAFVGRVSPEKRLDRAIAIATRVGLPLRVAAKVDAADREHWRRVIEPLLRGNPLVEFIGEVDDAGKQELLGQALALLFPIDWPEPFGLVMIEANACGTPVIAWRNGSTPEIIEPGLNGVLVGSIEEAVAAVRRIERLDRRRIRRRFEERFSVERQAQDYEALYAGLLERMPRDSDNQGTVPPPLLHVA